MVVQNKITFLTILLLSGSLLTLVSCGKSDKNSSRAAVPVVSVSPHVEEEQQDDQGIYKAILRPINSEISGETSGTIEFRIEGDDVVVESSIRGAPAGVKHLQNIFVSSRCPEIKADTNKDNVIDLMEAMTQTGLILIPLDSDLSEQLDGIEYGPIANTAGSYIYRRSSTLSRILADLRSPDPDLHDSIVKLPEGKDLMLGGRVVMIHGVKSNSNIPDSVKSISYLTKEQSLPIACGVLIRQ